MRAQPGQHVVAQRLRLEHHRVGAVPGDVAGELVGGADVQLDHLAVAAAQLPGADGPPGPTQRGRPPVGHPHPGLPAGRRRGHVGDGLGDDPAQVDAVRHGDRAGRADRGDARSDPGQPEGAGGVAVAVVAHQIPAALLGDHAPGLDGAGGVRLGPRRPVRKLHGLTGVDGGQQDSEHFFRAAQSGHSGRGGDGDRRRVIQGVDVDAGRAQLEQRALGRGDQFGRLPQLGGHRHRRRLVRGQVDRRERIGVAVDAVALGGVHRRDPPHLQRDAQVAQLVLVPLEHAGERLGADALRVTRHARPDLFCRDVAAGGQQGNDQIHQPFDF